MMFMRRARGQAGPDEPAAGLEVKPLDELSAVIALAKFQQHLHQLLGGFKASNPGKLFFESPEKACVTAVALTLAQEIGRAFHPKRADNGVAIRPYELRAVIRPQDKDSIHSTGSLPNSTSAP
jgi:hypothetical protein